MDVKTSAVIAAPPAAVFARVADIPRWADHIGAITRIEMLSEGPIGVGTRFRETRTMHGRAASEVMEVARFEAPRLLVLTAESCGTRYRVEHLFEPAPEGTRLTVTFAGEPVTFISRLMAGLAWLMIGSVRKALAGDLADLKAAIESTPM